MLQDFGLYFELGYQHILDIKGYDHILFVAALCGIYLLKDWRKVLILVSAFTIGHSVTLALSLFNQMRMNTPLIEFLIPVTILVTALVNIFSKSFSQKNIKFNYFMAFVFGLIHGMGFSNYLKSLLGSDTFIITQLLAFNLGLEVGQLVIVIIIMLFSYITMQLLKVKQREWNLFLSSAIFGMALIMAAERFSTL
ncbi:MAG TPA: HupE/UreJ family protein [Sphingobacteriaceae bacterium]|nr:HupE/UreJ family protein [Sphingobacteriaceae bacterium]